MNNAADQVELQHLSNYTAVETVYQGTRTLVYRAVCRSDDQPAVIKILRSSHPHPDELLQFRNQYTITKNLAIPGVVQPIALETYGNGYALVMADVGGISLDQYLKAHPLSVEEVLAIAQQFADILHHLHQAHVIHKDIKPANVLIHPETQQIWLIDFSIASLLPKETQEIQTPSGLEGTLAYLAPEQTGRMNRGIDYRADFYALGVTLFELLTGKLPFQSEEPMALIHSHIAQPPPSAQALNAEIPLLLSQLVQKLMAKNAEERYQSALGLKHDLALVHEARRAGAAPTALALGEADRSDRFLIPEKLYGREVEVQTLLNAFERVSQGASELMLVAGFSGIGKTAVINEVHKPITRQRGYFIKGKFDQFNRNVPFSAFIQAFRSLIQQLLGESDAALHHWKTKILAAVGQNGQVLIDVIPELARIIGEQPPVVALSNSAAQNRFNLLFGRFVRVFTMPEHPLVVFLDDLQWADAATLDLLKLLMDESAAGYFLVLGAYRDNEVFPVHPLMITLQGLEKQGATWHTLTLAPLPEASVTQLVADTLLCGAETATPLAQLVYGKTKGNPFFTTQFLQGLHGDRWITFDPDRGYWQCDLAQVQQLALTDDVVQFMVGQLRKLPTATQEVLKLAACVGNRFDLETLAMICEGDQASVSENLWRSLQAGLVIPESETYKFFQGASVQPQNSAIAVKVGYRFLHDRIQQAAYTLMPDRDRATAHLKLAEALEQIHSTTAANSAIFDIVNHYNQADLSGLDAQKSRHIVALNLKAGKQAMAATAFESANAYFEQALRLILNLHKHPWQADYGLMFELCVDLIRVKIACLLWEESRRASQLLYQKSCSPIDKSVSLQLLIEQSTQMGEFAQAIDDGREALTLLEEHIPEHNLDQALEDAIAEIRRQPQAIAQLQQDQLQSLTDRRLRQVLSILSSLDAAAYLTSADFWQVINALSVKITLLHGITAEGVAGLARFGQILCGRLDGSYAEGTVFGQSAMALSDRYPEQKGLVYFEMGLSINHWLQPLAKNIDYFQLGFQAAMDSGVTLYADYNLMFQPYYRHYMGQPIADNLRLTEQYIAFVEKSKNALADVLLQGMFSHLQRLALTIPADEWQQRSTAFIEQAEAQQNGLAIAIHAISAGQIYYLFGEWGAAEAALATAAGRCSALLGYFSLIEYALYYALTRLQKARPKEGPLEQRQMDKDCGVQDCDEFQGVVEDLRHWAKLNPGNCGHKYDLICAELGRLRQDWAEAMALYDRAIAGAKQGGYLQEEALASELAAKFYLDWGKEKVAAVYMQDAYYGYSRWGAMAKVTDLEARYPELLRPILQPPAASVDMLTTLTSFAQLAGSASSGTYQSAGGADFNQGFDFASILRASQVLSSTIQLDELLYQFTQIILQSSGGDHCALILPNEQGEWQVRAVATPEDIRLCAEPLNSSQNLPVKLIQYVKNTQEVVVIHQLKTDLPIVDDYLKQHQPKSVLCLPILNQSRCIGTILLENRLTDGIFTDGRIVVLNFLCTQAAISLENARLYESVVLKSSVIESSTDGIAIFEDGKYIYLNEAHVSLFGYEIDELMGQSWDKLYSPVEIERLSTTVFPALAQSKRWSGEAIALRKDGSAFAEEVSLLYLDSSKLICTCRDISERKKTENALLESELKFRNLISNLNSAVYRCLNNENWTMEFISDAIFDLSGYPAADFIDNHKRTFASIIHPDDLEITYSIIESVESNKPYTLEYRIVHRDGSIRWVTERGKGVFNDAGEVTHFDGIIVDISDRKAAEQKLFESETFLKTLVDTFPLSIFWKDRESRHIGANRKFLQDAGFKNAEEIVGLSDFDMPWTEAEALAFRAADQEVMKSDKPKLGIIKIQPQADGTQIWLEINKLPLHDPNGNVSGILGTYQDISDRKRAEAAVIQKSHDLEKALAELQNAQLQLVQNEKMSALGGLVAGVAHEINNPVGCILGNVGATQDYISDLLGLLDLYIEQFPEPGPDIARELDAVDLDYVREDLPELIRAMKDSGDRITEISKSLRTFSRADTDIKQAFNLHEGIDSTVLILRHRLKANDQHPEIEIVRDYGNIPKIDCFPGQLNQVFMNILANAIDALDEVSQQRSFEEMKAHPHRITIRTAVDNHQVTVAIADNGPGIPEEIKTKIFDHLFTTKKVGKGTGLGLAIAHQIVVDTHSGSLEVQSELGHGTEFLISLPVK
ncbi:MAG: PAS domain S-box protein [Leptolyngbyaceae cyanobacterium]